VRVGLLLAFGGAVLPLTLGCVLLTSAGGAGTTPTTKTPLPRATPYALEPAAGICADPAGDQVVMTLEPGIPDPRCLIVHSGQRLRVVNHTGADVVIAIGPFSFPMPANSETTIGPTFGEYLLSGVHALRADPCCGGELWLRE